MHRTFGRDVAGSISWGGIFCGCPYDKEITNLGSVFGDGLLHLHDPVGWGFT